MLGKKNTGTLWCAALNAFVEVGSCLERKKRATDSPAGILGTAACGAVSKFDSQLGPG